LANFSGTLKIENSSFFVSSESEQISGTALKQHFMVTDTEKAQIYDLK